MTLAEKFLHRFAYRDKVALRGLPKRDPLHDGSEGVQDGGFHRCHSLPTYPLCKKRASVLAGKPCFGNHLASNTVMSAPTRAISNCMFLRQYVLPTCCITDISKPWNQRYTHSEPFKISRCKCIIEKCGERRGM